MKDTDKVEVTPEKSESTNPSEKKEVKPLEEDKVISSPEFDDKPDDLTDKDN